VLSFDLSDKGGPTSSCATAGIALWIIATLRPPYLTKDAFVKVEILQGVNQTCFKVRDVPVLYLGRDLLP
jgi:hypothetical protein